MIRFLLRDDPERVGFFVFWREELGSGLPNGDDIDGKDLALAMEFQLKPVGSQSLHHQPHLIGGSIAFGLRDDVVTVSLDPGWTGRVLEWLDSVRPLHQELQGGSIRLESSARKSELDHSGVLPRRLGSSRFAWCDGCYFKSWSFRKVLAVAMIKR